MNTKNNSRRRSSVERIERVFFELLQTRELNRITVADVCREAQINRSTFYANFDDIYDLADKIRIRLEKEVSALYDNKTSMWVKQGDFLRLFYHMRDNQLFYRTYFKLGYDSEHTAHFYDAEQAADLFEEPSLAYHLEFFRNGFNAVVKMWLNGGCRETPEELEEIIESEYTGRLEK